MAEHADKSDRTERIERTQQDDEEQPRARRQVDWRGVRGQVAGWLASIVRWVGLIFALILVLHVIFVIGDGNPENGIVSFITDWADTLSIGFKDLFTPEDAKLRVLINYGIAALFWLVVSAILARIFRRIGGSSI